MERNLLVREYNLLRQDVQRLEKQLERMEQHEGEDGTPEDVAGQCALVDTIAAKRRRLAELRAIIYP